MTGYEAREQRLLDMGWFIPSQVWPPLKSVPIWKPDFSLVKRIVPNLISLDFFGTQPLATPDSLIFSMRALYNKDVQ